MKIRVQLLEYETPKELDQHIEQFVSFCKLLKLPYAKVENRHYDDTFVIPLPIEHRLLHWKINGVLAFCMINDYVYDFVDDDYPSF